MSSDRLERGEAATIRFGAFLPTFVEERGVEGRRLADFARKAEELGFHSLWVTDHLLKATRFYRLSWLEPLTALTQAAAVTERVLLGTGILILPLRHPVLLAKQIATLDLISGGRFVLGAGTGWFDREFEAVGRSKRERGRLTDEVLELVSRLLTEPSVTHHGRHFRLSDVSIEPRPPARTPFWIAGGSQVPKDGSPERPHLADAVLRRIARWEGWIARPTALPDQIGRDFATIRGAVEGRERGWDGFVAAHENFVHVVDTTDHEEALTVQKERFAAVMGTERSFDYLSSVYLSGTPDEIVERVWERIEKGIEYVLLHPLAVDPGQLELWHDLVVDPIRKRWSLRGGGEGVS